MAFVHPAKQGFFVNKRQRGTRDPSGVKTRGAERVRFNAEREFPGVYYGGAFRLKHPGFDGPAYSQTSSSEMTLPSESYLRMIFFFGACPLV